MFASPPSHLIGIVVCLAALAQANGLVQQLGHGLVVAVKLALGLGLDETIILQLRHGLVGETLQPKQSRLCVKEGLTYGDQLTCVDSVAPQRMNTCHS